MQDTTQQSIACPQLAYALRAIRTITQFNEHMRTILMYPLSNSQQRHSGILLFLLPLKVIVDIFSFLSFCINAICQLSIVNVTHKNRSNSRSVHIIVDISAKLRTLLGSSYEPPWLLSTLINDSQLPWQLLSIPMHTTRHHSSN